MKDRVLVISMPRTGSSMLCDIIEQAGGHENLCEAINACASPQQRRSFQSDRETYYTLVADTLTQHEKAVVKLQHGIEFIESPHAQTIEGLRFVYLYREDDVAAYISGALSQITRVFMITTDGSQEWPFPRQFERQESQSKAEKELREEIAGNEGRQWAVAYLAAQRAGYHRERKGKMEAILNRVPGVLRVRFEDMVQDPSATVQTVLGLSKRVIPRTIKQGDKLNTKIRGMVESILGKEGGT